MVDLIFCADGYDSCAYIDTQRVDLFLAVCDVAHGGRAVLVLVGRVHTPTNDI